MVLQVLERPSLPRSLSSSAPAAPASPALTYLLHDPFTRLSELHYRGTAHYPSLHSLPSYDPSTLLRIECRGEGGTWVLYKGG